MCTLKSDCPSTPFLLLVFLHDSLAPTQKCMAKHGSNCNCMQKRSLQATYERNNSMKSTYGNTTAVTACIHLLRNSGSSCVASSAHRPWSSNNRKNLFLCCNIDFAVCARISRSTAFRHSRTCHAHGYARRHSIAA